MGSITNCAERFGRMRIALVHSYYRSAMPSGENTMVDLQAELLRSAGHEVEVVARHSDDHTAGAAGAARAAWDVATGRGFDPTARLSALAPDVVHVHNLFPNFATGWLADWRGPLVATLHNYRALCAAATLVRNDSPCSLCPDGDRWAGVRHGCYRGSRAATLPLALHHRRGLVHDPVVQRADRLITLSNRAHGIFLRYGAPADRLVLLPNGLPPQPTGDGTGTVARTGGGTDVLAGAGVGVTGGESPAAAERSGWAAVGRLSPEKGWEWLLPRWPTDQSLDVYGSGPLLERLRDLAPPAVRFLGSVPNAELRASLSAYRGMVFAGINPEGAYPLTAVEALAAGLPLVARAGGAAADMVAAWDCGAIFGGATNGDGPGSLSEALAAASSPGMSGRAGAVFAERFSARSWIGGLEGLYRGLC